MGKIGDLATVLWHMKLIVCKMVTMYFSLGCTRSEGKEIKLPGQNPSKTKTTLELSYYTILAKFVEFHLYCWDS